jgi:hypothetical protein
MAFLFNHQHFLKGFAQFWREELLTKLHFSVAIILHFSLRRKELIAILKKKRVTIVKFSNLRSNIDIFL